MISDPSILSVTGSSAEPAGFLGPGPQARKPSASTPSKPAVRRCSSRYSRAWEGGEEGVWTVDLDVAVVPAEAAPVEVNVSCDAFEGTPLQGAGTILAVGDDLLVTLCSNASTGYAWGEPQVSDPAVVALAGMRSDAPASPLPGAPGSQSWAFEALAAGSAVIHLGYSQPWEGGAKDAWTYDLDVTVR